MTFQANQVFDASAMKSVVKGLQDSALKGTGSVHREKLTTVENTLYGIEPHHQVDITFVHLSRCWRWEAELPETTRQLVVPVKPMPCDSCKDECFFHDSGRGTECWPVRMPVFVPPRFMGGYTLENTFTLMGRFSVPQANLLAALTQWIVEQNPDISDGFITNGERKPACDALTTRISLAHRGVMR